MNYVKHANLNKNKQKSDKAKRNCKPGTLQKSEEKRGITGRDMDMNTDSCPTKINCQLQFAWLCK